MQKIILSLVRIIIGGLTAQNDPEASQSWDSCLYSAEEERDFVRDYLGPTLQKEGLGHLNLMIWDHNRDAIYERARVVYRPVEISASTASSL